MWVLWTQLGQDRPHPLPDTLHVSGLPQNKVLCIACPSASNSIAPPSFLGSFPSLLQEALLDPRLGSHPLWDPHSRPALSGSLLPGL